MTEDSLSFLTSELKQLKEIKNKVQGHGGSFTNSIKQKLCTSVIRYDRFKTFPIFIKTKNEMRFQTCFRESPCLSWMYLRNAVVHCKVVALSVSIVQKGTRRLSSSQQTRILRLQANTQNHQPRARGKGKIQKTGRLFTCATSHGLWGLLCVCYKLCVLVLLHTSRLIFTEWVKCFEISFGLFTE